MLIPAVDQCWRCRNYPTASNMAKKQADLKAREERGEVLTTKQFGSVSEPFICHSTFPQYSLSNSFSCFCWDTFRCHIQTGHSGRQFT